MFSSTGMSAKCQKQTLTRQFDDLDPRGFVDGLALLAIEKLTLAKQRCTSEHALLSSALRLRYDPQAMEAD